jgi:hypothetical protein
MPKEMEVCGLCRGIDAHSYSCLYWQAIENTEEKEASK